MTRRRGSSRLPWPRWMLVKAKVRCMEPGREHDFRAPAPGLFWPFRAGRPRMILCRAHAESHGHTCPVQLLTHVPFDGKARQVGDN